jgi:hypothetical protein
MSNRALEVLYGFLIYNKRYMEVLYRFLIYNKRYMEVLYRLLICSIKVHGSSLRVFDLQHKGTWKFFTGF